MKSLVKVFLVLFLGLAGCDKPDDAPVAPETDKDFSALTQIMQDNISAFNENAGLVLMNKEGQILYKQYFGSYTDNTYLPIASASKWPSMATLMALVEDPTLEIALEDKVSKFFPAAFSANERNDINLRQLMSHTSGLAGASPWISFNDITVAQATEGIGQGGTINSNTAQATPISFNPVGSKFAYGGVSMHVAGGIAEKVTDKSWDLIFKERIADKCEMPNTNYLGLGPTINYRIAGGSGTRMMEYANFLLMLINEGRYNGVQVLSEASVNEILSDQTNPVPITFSPYENDPLRSSFRYGLGCWIEEYTDGAPTAFGAQGAFGFSPWIDTKRNVVGILFVQTNLGKVNTLPNPKNAPYTLVRNKINGILDAQ